MGQSGDLPTLVATLGNFTSGFQVMRFCCFRIHSLSLMKNFKSKRIGKKEYYFSIVVVIIIKENKTVKSHIALAFNSFVVFKIFLLFLKMV